MRRLSPRRRPAAGLDSAGSAFRGSGRPERRLHRRSRWGNERDGIGSGQCPQRPAALAVRSGHRRMHGPVGGLHRRWRHPGPFGHAPRPAAGRRRDEHGRRHPGHHSDPDRHGARHAGADPDLVHDRAGDLDGQRDADRRPEPDQHPQRQRDERAQQHRGESRERQLDELPPGDEHQQRRRHQRRGEHHSSWSRTSRAPTTSPTPRSRPTHCRRPRRSPPPPPRASPSR